MPTPSNNDRYSEVAIEAKQLSQKQQALKKKNSLFLWLLVLRLLFLPFLVLLLLYFEREGTDKNTIIIWLFGIMTFNYLFGFLLGYIRITLFNLYLDVERKWSNLTDKVDWETMRKKQLYDELDERVQKAIDDFYRFNHSFYNPFKFHAEKKKWRLDFSYFLGVIYSIEIIACPGIAVAILL